MEIGVMNSSDIRKYNRMDAPFFLKIKPMVEDFFKNHGIEGERVYKRNQPLTGLPEMDTHQILVNYALIHYFFAYTELSQRV